MELRDEVGVRVVHVVRVRGERARSERHDREAPLYGHGRVVVDRGRREQDEHDDRARAASPRRVRGAAAPATMPAITAYVVRRLRAGPHDEVEERDEQRGVQRLGHREQREPHHHRMHDHEEADARRARPRGAGGCGRTRSTPSRRIAPSAGSPATVLARPRRRFVSRRNSVNPCGCGPERVPSCDAGCSRS